jgi:hypothetical protein
MEIINGMRILALECRNEHVKMRAATRHFAARFIDRKTGGAWTKIHSNGAAQIGEQDNHTQGCTYPLGGFDLAVSGTDDSL